MIKIAVYHIFWNMIKKSKYDEKNNLYLSPPPPLNLQKTLVAQTHSNCCSLHIAYFSIKVPTLHSQTYLSQKIRNFLIFSSLCFKCHHHQARLKLFFRITF